MTENILAILFVFIKAVIGNDGLPPELRYSWPLSQPAFRCLGIDMRFAGNLVFDGS